LIRTPFSLESYGLTTRRAWRVALQAFVWTTPILLFLLILKLALMRWEPWMVGRTVLDPGAIFVNRGGFVLKLFLLYVVIYIIHSPLQEFIARTGLQGTLQHFTPVPPGRVNWKAIVVSNLIFATAHTYLGLWFCWQYSCPAYSGAGCSPNSARS
jgi:membrane protease YdiL (CAAX protease family)